MPKRELLLHAPGEPPQTTEPAANRPCQAVRPRGGEATEVVQDPERGEPALLERLLGACDPVSSPAAKTARRLVRSQRSCWTIQPPAAASQLHAQPACRASSIDGTKP